jgi:hypothetical protein
LGHDRGGSTAESGSRAIEAAPKEPKSGSPGRGGTRTQLGESQARGSVAHEPICPPSRRRVHRRVRAAHYRCLLHTRCANSVPAWQHAAHAAPKHAASLDAGHTRPRSARGGPHESRGSCSQRTGATRLPLQLSAVGRSTSSPQECYRRAAFHQAGELLTEVAPGASPSGTTEPQPSPPAQDGWKSAAAAAAPGPPREMRGLRRPQQPPPLRQL